MNYESLLKLITLLASGELFINNLTPGVLTIEEIILDVILFIIILVCVIFHKRLRVLEVKLPFVDDLLNCVEEYCSDESEKESEKDCVEESEKNSNDDVNNINSSFFVEMNKKEENNEKDEMLIEKE